MRKILYHPFGEGLLLFLDRDRAQVNLALESRQVSQLASAILA